MFEVSQKNSPKIFGRPTQCPVDFLWVDYGDDSSQARHSTPSRKHNFIKTRSHRLRKETKLEKLKSSITPLPKGNAPAIRDSIRSRERRDTSPTSDEFNLYGPVILHSPKAGVAEAYPSLCLEMNEDMDLYFDYYKVYVSKVSFPFSATDMTVWFFRQALSQPALAEVILFLSAASRTANLYTRGACPQDVNRCARDMLQLRSRAIKSLQEILARPSEIRSEFTVLLITNLFCIEASQGNLKAVEAHLAGLKAIISELGGLDTLGDLTISTIYCCELFYGILKSSPPVFDLSRKWMLRTQVDSAIFRGYSASSTVGARFFSSPLSQNICPELHSILRSFQQLISHYESIEGTDTRSLPLENDFLLLLVRQLYSLPYDCSLTPAQDTIRVSILAYCVVRIWKFEGKPCIEYLIRTLRRSLERSRSVLETTAPELVFWSLFVGALASPGLECQKWCVARLKKSARQLSLKDWYSAVLVLQGFFFVCRPINEPAKCLWDSIISMTDCGDGSLIRWWDRGHDAVQMHNDVER